MAIKKRSKKNAEIYANFSLEIEKPEGSKFSKEEVILVLRNRSDGASSAIDEDGVCAWRTYWNDYENDLREITEVFPDYLITLSAEGQEHNDSWVAFFKNGKSYSERMPEWTPGDFDAKRLA